MGGINNFCAGESPIVLLFCQSTKKVINKLVLIKMRIFWSGGMESQNVC